MISGLLTESEIRDLTGYSTPGRQVEALQAAGFKRARRSRNGHVIVERAHYEAVCRGEYERLDARQPAAQSSPVRTGFLKRA